jgi:uncharacterized protein (TIGR02594 family)
MSTEPKWLTIARKDIGLKEGPGMKNNPRVIQMFKEAGHPEISSDGVAWCAAATGAWLKEAGFKPSGSLLALSYAKWGQPLAGPVVGAIACRTRTGGGHVGFVVSTAPGVVNLLAGNQSDAVNIAAHPRNAFVAFRWPPGAPLPTAARAPLEPHHPKPKMRRRSHV